MTPISLTPWDLAAAGSLIAFDAVLSIALRLDLHRRILWAAARMVVQLLAIGVLLRFVFDSRHPALTVAIVAAMAAIAAREMTVRTERRLPGPVGFGLSLGAVTLATLVALGLALATAIRPTPWYDPRYAIAIAGIVLGSVLNAGSLTLDGVLSGAARQRAAIEAQLALGASFRASTAPLLREALRRGLLPAVNQMSAAGVITLPGAMTGQILAGVEPMEAVKYQILLMFLLTGASALAAVVVGFGAMRLLTDDRQRLRLDRLVS